MGHLIVPERTVDYALISLDRGMYILLKRLVLMAEDC